MREQSSGLKLTELTIDRMLLKIVSDVEAGFGKMVEIQNKDFLMIHTVIAARKCEHYRTGVGR